MDAKLDNALDAFVLQLEQQGYARSTRRSYEASARHFCETLASEGGRISETLIECAVKTVLQRYSASSRKSRKYSLSRFVIFIRETGRLNMPVTPAAKSSDRKELEEQLTVYLAEQRGLSAATVATCQDEVRRFLNFQFGNGELGDLDTITENDIVAFLTRPAERPGPISACVLLVICAASSYFCFGAVGRSEILPSVFCQ
ncbi:site-specific integrase [Cerasicoccus arenae]|uniref:site-specific integrase n=1 Tax=Cerasicoccus arenae TaxID=424488 RepID=UPI0016799DEE|nr:site-specific integrase [Cerasicoccus arenae]MBK1858761.1 site-specific integrase [Cerasicoccus arenae]